MEEAPNGPGPASWRWDLTCTRRVSTTLTPMVLRHSCRRQLAVSGVVVSSSVGSVVVSCLVSVGVGPISLLCCCSSAAFGWSAAMPLSRLVPECAESAHWRASAPPSMRVRNNDVQHRHHGLERHQQQRERVPSVPSISSMLLSPAPPPSPHARRVDAAPREPPSPPLPALSAGREATSEPTPPPRQRRHERGQSTSTVRSEGEEGAVERE